MTVPKEFEQIVETFADEQPSTDILQQEALKIAEATLLSLELTN